jgi:methylmalonyl-CoA/ethylmalonyl-CoA epimerase
MIINIKKIFKFHHIGYACNNLEQSLLYFKKKGFIKSSKVFIDRKQGVKGVFVKKNFLRIEILQNLKTSNKLTPFLKKNIFFYHIAFKVNDFSKAISILTKRKFYLISKPVYSIFFKKKICFFYINKNLLFELILN